MRNYDQRIKQINLEYLYKHKKEEIKAQKHTGKFAVIKDSRYSASFIREFSFKNPLYVTSQELSHLVVGILRQLPQENKPYLILNPAKRIPNHIFNAANQAKKADEYTFYLNYIKVKPEQIILEEKNIDKSESNIYPELPSPYEKPLWLREFEKVTNYEKDKIEAYLTGFLEAENEDEFKLDRNPAKLRRLEIELARDAFCKMEL